MNAQEMFKELQKHEPCEGLVDWIKTSLFERMKQSGNMTAFYSCSSLSLWSSMSFIHSMHSLGYTVTIECEDRPASIPCYKITIDIVVPGR